MSIRAVGLEINDKEIKRIVNNEVEKYVKRYQSAGRKAMKELRDQYTVDWFLNESDTMLKSLRYSDWMEQRDGNAILYFNSYVDMDAFEAQVAQNDTSIYKWKEKYNADINPAEFLLDLQWKQGIHGLPLSWTHPNYRFGQFGEPPYTNPYYNQGTSMEEYIEDGIRTNWEKTVNKYVKK